MGNIYKAIDMTDMDVYAVIVSHPFFLGGGVGVEGYNI